MNKRQQPDWIHDFIEDQNQAGVPYTVTGRMRPASAALGWFLVIYTSTSLALLFTIIFTTGSDLTIVFVTILDAILLVAGIRMIRRFRKVKK